MSRLVTDLPHSSNIRQTMRRLVMTSCSAALIALAGLSASGHVQPAVAQALAQQVPALDTSKLPRPAAQKVLVALPQTTIILSAETVPVAAKAAIDLLERNGWQRFVAPGTTAATSATSETHQLKKGRQALTLFVQTAPAHANATAISYSEMPLTRDLPFPAKAENIRFSPSPLSLDAAVPQAFPALLAFYRTELTTSGWSLHSASDGSTPKTIPTGENMHHAFFTHPAHGALHVTVKDAGNQGSSLTIRTVPASVLPGAQVARAPEPQSTQPQPSQPSPQATAHAQLGQQVDAMAQDLMKQAMQPPPPGGLEAAMTAARNAGVRIDVPGKAQSGTAAPSPAAPNEPALERDEIGGFPVPKSASEKAREKTNWRIEVTATVRASTDAVLAFYGRELAAMGWRETTPKRTEAARTIVAYASADGPAVLTLERSGRDTRISLLLRKEAEARKAGILPKPGQARILFGSMLDAESSVTIAGKTLKVAAGIGSKAPDGPSIEVAPGKHKVTIKSPGQPEMVEIVTVRADDVWGVLLGPGGALPLPMY